MKKSVLIAILFITASLLAACSTKANVPENVASAAQSNWEYYTWSEDLGGDMWRGGGWHLVEADKTKPFTITDAQQGQVPDDLKLLMSMGMNSYSGEVWCLNVSPTLYFGYGDNLYDDITSNNFLMFQQSNGNWSELGSVWNEPWVNFLYPPNTYKYTVNFYMGVNKSMFEMMGCDNWLE
ncbi:MAG: hypothetical protein FP831_13745 [Anaerolineae bacterium]|nr:hypothetical protein [Anaerolineae bacterium]